KIADLVIQRTRREANKTAETVQEILNLLKRHSKVDFSRYKPSTIYRRLQRRMKANHLESLEQYAELLKHDDAETKRLFQDMLISVTAFFRDQEQYRALKSALKRYLLENRKITNLRVWSAACSTGEEPYSIAIILNELM